MILASLILSATFAGSMCALLIAGKDEKSSSSATEHKQPEIHIHNNSYGGNCSSMSYGGNSGSNSTSKNNNMHSENTTDNISEDMINEKLNNLREDMMRYQQYDDVMMEQIDLLNRFMNK